MTDKRQNFARYVALTAAIFAALAVAFTVYVLSEKQIGRANDQRHDSLLLADELRQSSDELTRMARTYVVTGDPLYKNYYQTILDIRDGKEPRPPGYQTIYWDLVLASRQAPGRQEGQAVALLDLMRQAGFSQQEFQKLAEAKANSDALTATEFAAMQLVESSGPEAESTRSRARMMMHDEQYHQAKAAIMQPIDEFHTLLEARTYSAVKAAESKALILRIVFSVFALILVFMLFRVNSFLRRTLGGSVDDVHEHIARIGRGDFTSSIPRADATENSVLGWLAKTQDQLKKIDLERRQAEEETKKSLRFQQVLMDAVPSPIFYKDAECVYLGGNKAFVNYLGLSAEQFIGKTVHEIAPAHLAEVYDAADRALLKASGVQTYEAAVVYGDGSLRDVIFSKAVFADAEGRVAGLIGVILDVTERKQVEAELLRSNTELEQFSYSISHDMRQPLRMISSYLQLLEMGLANQLDDAKREYFNFAIDAAKRLDAMLLGLLEYSRVGRLGEPLAWIESRAALDEALLYLRPAIAEARAEMSITGDWPQIFFSTDEMLRLLQNLIDNALKFRVAGRTPQIAVSGESAGERWRLRIADNGIGILPDQAGRLFQVFQRLQSRADFEGTGIGLALCRKIVEHHGGSIRVESEGEGKGSCFVVELPLAEEVVE